ncbi:hypothetical protein LTR37_004503 [Vermiconidia calcicola]|uniref:Uncharacterized protein n=1 Tax=Vermiconidia calcicola TaxID=1690605 RepID=A0ACC3NNP1_9PEZI|nr:hypothetical protein LTR37_004503 [Vermiconidia calcicola]
MRYTLGLFSAAALLVNALPQAVEEQPSQCATTIGLPGGCCPPRSSASETVLIDCKVLGRLLDNVSYDRDYVYDGEYL